VEFGHKGSKNSFFEPKNEAKSGVEVTFSLTVKKCKLLQLS
jgi:hypothetical protein